jgi:CubicO group peptidase (beta-lactamase class C family)
MLRKKLYFLLSLGLLLNFCSLSNSIQAQALESSPATTPVLRSDRLLHFMEQEAAANKLVGGVNLVYHEGEIVQTRTFGYQDRESKSPMRPDAIFYIQSMTKPIVSVAFMMLYEEGHFELNDPLSQYLPAFEEQEVAQFAGEDESGKMTKVAAQNPITIKQVLSHTTGKRHGIMGSELDKVYMRQLYFKPAKTIADRVEALAGLPLEFEPGTAWSYSASPTSWLC